MFVLGIHTGEMRNKLAWSAITGSNLLDELRKGEKGEKATQAMKDVENSGIDFSSTLYLYTKSDTRFSNGMRVAAVLPVKDSKKVAAYIRKYAPGIAIHTVKDRNEVMIDGKMYIGWNDDALVAMNPIVTKREHSEAAKVDTIGGMPVQGDAYTWTEDIADSAGTVAEMDLAFTPSKDAAITGNSHFTKLENEGHDITMWVGYDALMDAYGSKGMGMMGLPMGNALWKSSAMAAGIDFEKGQIDGEMRYYASDSMRPVAKEFGKENIDKDLLSRLPSANLNFALGYHIAPGAIKMMLEKLGLSGMANLALMQKGMSVDDILGAFSGDMALALNNFRVESKMQEIDSATQKDFGLTPYPVTKPNMDFVYAMKIGDRAKLDKLLGLINQAEILQQTAPNTYVFPNAPQGTSIVIGDKYIAISSNAPGAQAFLSKSSGNMPEAVSKEISGHPAGLWADIHSFMNGAGAMANNSPSDSIAFNAVKNMFTTLTAHGGEYKGEATEYKMSLGFVNKDENSLVQVLHLVQQLVAMNKKDAVAIR